MPLRIQILYFYVLWIVYYLIKCIFY